MEQIGFKIREMGLNLYRLLKNAHLRRSSHPSSLQRTFKYASVLRISGALHLGIFDQPEKNGFFNRLFILEFAIVVSSTKESALPRLFQACQPRLCIIS
jgi:hypothetical protein